MPSFAANFSQPEYTDIIEQIPKKITDYFSHQWQDRQNLAFPIETLNILIEACHRNLLDLNDNPRAGLERLNSAASNLMGQALVPAPPFQIDDQRILLAAIEVHLEAMREGYRIGLMHGESPSFRRNNFSLPSENRQPRTVHHVHYVYERDTFWRDMFIWNAILDSHRSFGYRPLPPYHRAHVEPWYPSFPEQHASKKSKDDDGASALFYLMVAAVAAAAAVYGTVHTLRTLDEVVHGEHLGTNLLKLGLVTSSAGLGSIAGLSLAAAAVANPVFCAIAGAIILGSLAYIPLNALQKSTLESQIEGDGRFQLSESESSHLKVKGFSPEKVNEAIRALAIEMKNTTAYAMNFWSDGNKRRGQIIDTLRMLKSGQIKVATLVVGKQAFKLVDDYTQELQKPQAAGFDEIPFAEMVQVVDESHPSFDKNAPVTTATEVSYTNSSFQTPSAPPLTKMSP